MSEYDKHSVPTALRLMSRKYIRKPACRELLIVAAKLIEERGDHLPVATYVDRMTEQMR